LNPNRDANHVFHPENPCLQTISSNSGMSASPMANAHPEQHQPVIPRGKLVAIMGAAAAAKPPCCA
jgi:hypothetical protein